MYNIAWNQFSKIDSYAWLSEYFAYEERPYRHNAFCHYTSLSAIDKIIGENKLWLGSVKKFNDKRDAEQFTTPEKYFSLCFSTGINENLSLWYMYGGMDGKGSRIRLTPSCVKKLVRDSNYELHELVSKEEGESKMIKVLSPSDFEKTFDDVIYCGHKPAQGYYDLKYNTMTNYQVPEGDFERFSKERLGFQKGLIWYYEKETRLLLKISDDVASLLDANKCYIIIMRFNEQTKKQFKIDLAPEFKSVSDGIIRYENIQSFVSDTSRVALSKHAGECEMDFCRKCTKTKEA